MFGAITHIVPQLIERQWHCENGVSRTFWFALVGTIIFFVSMTVTGIVQSSFFTRSDLPFVDIGKKLLPFIGFSTIGLMLIAIANITLFINLLRTTAALCCDGFCKKKTKEVRR